MLLLLVIAQQAQALPTSSYATKVNNWQGSKYRSETTNDGTISCRVDYAVYDTLAPMSNAESLFVSPIMSLIPDKEYLYVYQVFNDLTNSEGTPSEMPIASFAIFNLDKTALNVASQDLNAKDDGTGGIGPSDKGLAEGDTKAVWTFAGSGHLLIKDKHSWLLVLGSDSPPVKGDYEIKSKASDFPSSPEPATIALLSAGSLFLARLRKRK